MVKSMNTIKLTKDELAAIQESLKKAGERKLKQFRESFDPNDMGFAGRKEGV